jgi:hypothetical protein
MKLKDLLQNLHWPAEETGSKGTLTWARASENHPDHLQSASLVVSPRSVRCRLISVLGQGLPEPHLDIEWQLDENLAPTLIRFIYAGQIQPLNEARAIEVFTELIEALNARPVFQMMGRQREAITLAPNAGAVILAAAAASTNTVGGASVTSPATTTVR